MTDRFGHLVFRIYSWQIQVMDAQQDLQPLSPERRARIIAGAAEIFTRDGYEGASVADIARAAGVSKGTLYNYYPSKQALFAAYVTNNCAQILQEIFGEMHNDAPIESELARIGRSMLRMMLSARGRAMFRVVVMEASKFPELARAFAEAGPQVMVRNMAGWIARRVEAGELAVEDPVFAAEQFFALAQTRLVMRSKVDAAYCASAAEIEHVVAGAVRVFIAAYGKSAF